jgi:hypothetical protein
VRCASPAQRTSRPEHVTTTRETRKTRTADGGERTSCSLQGHAITHTLTAEKLVPHGPPTASADATVQGCAGRTCLECVVRAAVNKRTRGKPSAAAISAVAFEALPTLNCTAGGNQQAQVRTRYLQGSGSSKGLQKKKLRAYVLLLCPPQSTTTPKRTDLSSAVVEFTG